MTFLSPGGITDHKANASNEIIRRTAIRGALVDAHFWGWAHPRNRNDDVDFMDDSGELVNVDFEQHVVFTVAGADNPCWLTMRSVMFRLPYARVL